MDGKNKVGVVGAVEEWHESQLARKALVDEEIFLVVAHRVAEIDSLHLPAVAFKLVDDHPVEVLFVDGIVAVEGGSVVVEDDCFVLVALVVGVEVVDKRRCLAFKLDVERLDDVQASPSRLPTNHPIYVSIVVHAYADRRRRVNVCVHLRVESKGLREIWDNGEVLIDIVVVRGIVLVRLAHG